MLGGTYSFHSWRSWIEDQLWHLELELGRLRLRVSLCRIHSLCRGSRNLVLVVMVMEMEKEMLMEKVVVVVVELVLLD